MKAMSEEELSLKEIHDAIEEHRQKHPYESEYK